MFVPVWTDAFEPNFLIKMFIAPDVCTEHLSLCQQALDFVPSFTLFILYPGSRVITPSDFWAKCCRLFITCLFSQYLYMDFFYIRKMKPNTWHAGIYIKKLLYKIPMTCSFFSFILLNIGHVVLLCSLDLIKMKTQISSTWPWFWGNNLIIHATIYLKLRNSLLKHGNKLLICGNKYFIIIFANGPKSACLCQANLCPICFFEIPQRTDTGSQNALSNNSAYALNSLIFL